MIIQKQFYNYQLQKYGSYRTVVEQFDPPIQDTIKCTCRAAKNVNITSLIHTGSIKFTKPLHGVSYINILQLKYHKHNNQYLQVLYMHAFYLLLPTFLKCLQIFSCHALCLTPTERSHLTKSSGDGVNSYCTFKYSCDNPNNSSLCAIDFVVSCLKPKTNCCILLFFVL